jgi:hypothetical protein
MGSMKLLKKFVTDNQGRVAVWQTPNFLLSMWFITMLLGKILPGGRGKAIVDLVAFVSLVAWSLLEIIEGSSYFRRVLGAVVMVMSIIGRLR